MSKNNVLILLFRRDLRVADHPILHHLASNSSHGFTHMCPIFVFPAQQIELSGFIKDGSKSPYPEARSEIAKYWRTGPHRAKFIAEAAWSLKESLESLGSGLVLRAGMTSEVLKGLIEGLGQTQQKVGAVWMTSEEGVEERRDEKAISTLCKEQGAEFKLWNDEKYFVDDRDVTIKDPSQPPDVFTLYRKETEPLRERPRHTVPKPEKSSLPPMVEESQIPAQHAPFSIPTTYNELEEAVVGPTRSVLPNLPPYPGGAASAHPFNGGEETAHTRLQHLIMSGAMKHYKDTRNGLLGTDFSTKLSAFLSQGCLTARQIHEELLKYEDGTDSTYKNAAGYGEGENDGTKAVRFELLWRDYMRLCNKKFKHRLFRIEGFRYDDQRYKEGEDGADKKPKWKSAVKETALPDQEPAPEQIHEIIQRYNLGTTGMGFIDASQRELLHTGYTSNRARQNVASFLTKHLGIDWRYGAEWYEMMLVDYDVSSNWANWQYVAGVGNDPRGEARIFNPVKQAFDYDKDGSYVKMWVPEVSQLERLENVFQVWTTSAEELEKVGLSSNPMVTDPVKRIDFSVEGKPKTNKRPFIRRTRGGPRRSSDGGGHPGPDQHQTPGGPSRLDASVPSFKSDGLRGGYRGGRGGPYRSGGGGGSRGYYTGRGGYNPRGGWMGGPPPPRQQGWVQGPHPGGPPPYQHGPPV